MSYWLMKSEPSVYSIDDLQKDGFSYWEGVRNYQARNFMEEMRNGDLAIFYHSNGSPSGAAGICRICQEAIPDSTAWDPSSAYYDRRSSPEKPIWMMVEVEFVEKFPKLISLKDLRKIPELNSFKLLEKGSRLSVMPVEPQHFEIIRKLSEAE